MPEHPPITRRNQFKVKSVIKEEKLAKKGKGKGKSGAEPKGKGTGKRGKGKGKKAKKSKKTSGSKKFGHHSLSSKRSMLFKANRTKKGSASKKRPTDSSVVESNQDHKIPKQESLDNADLEQAYAPQSKEFQPSKTNSKATKTSGKSAKAKAAASNSKAKKTARAKAAASKDSTTKNTAKSAKAKAAASKSSTTKNTAKSAKAKAAASKSKTKTAAAKAEAKVKSSKPKKDKQLSTQEILEIAEQVLQGKLKHTELEVNEGNVSNTFTFLFRDILQECQVADHCDGNCHHFEWLECDGVIRFDLYWKRSSIGVRLAGCRIRDDDELNEKQWVSAGYFSIGHCPAINYAAAKIFVSSLQIQSSLLCCFSHFKTIYMELYNINPNFHD